MTTRRFFSPAMLPLLLATWTWAPTAAGAQEALNPAQKQAFEALVRDYILQNPEIILESLSLMEARQKVEKEQAIRAALVSQRAALERDSGDPVVGNPDGDVTIVEFFDYQCTYCKSVMGPLMELVARDGNIRLVLKEFPILGPASEVAARASLAAARQGKYDAFHLDLMRLRGRLTEAAIYQVAREVGLDLAILRADMADPAIQAQIQKAYRLAQVLQIQGTPAFAIGDRLIPGAINQKQMAELVAEARQGG